MSTTSRERVLVHTGLAKFSLPYRPTESMVPLDRGAMGGYKGGCNEHFDDLRSESVDGIVAGLGRR
jgi:hypothetical protein